MSEIICISLDKKTANDVDAATKAGGYGSRSELIRLALNSFLLERRQSRELHGIVDAIVVISYRKENEEELSRITHDYSDMIEFQTHRHSNGRCVEIFSIRGDGVNVAKFHERVEKCRNADYCRMTIL